MAEKTTTAIFKEERERILCLPYKDGARVYNTFQEQANTVEVVDIVNDYPWILDTVQGTGKNVVFSSFIADKEGSANFRAVGDYDTGQNTARSPFTKKTNIPSCYIVERKNAINGSITTMLGLLGALDQIANGVQTFGNDLKGAIGGGLGAVAGFVTDITGDVIHGFKNILAKIIGNVFDQIDTLQADNNLNDELLNPYRFLYFTQDTKKRYVFPLLNADASSFLPTKLQWEPAKIEAPGAVGKIVGSVIDMFTEGAKFTTMLTNGSQLMNGNATSIDDIGSVSEAAKTFKYPQTGDALKINFTLYNTTRKNAWKENYRFLYLFAVRNLPFRLEAFSFLPPLLYDIIVPGIKRMPICALTQMKVTPVGTSRTLTRDNFITTNEQNATIQVIVPEAWQVELAFQSLIAPSANLLLSMFVGPLKIKSSGDIGRPKVSVLEKEYASTELQNADLEALNTLCKKIKDSEGREIAWKQMETVRAIGASEELMRHANNAWHTKANKEQMATGIKIILATFGEQAVVNPDGSVSTESVTRAADLLVEHGFAKPNSNWKEGDNPWDKIMRYPEDNDNVSWYNKKGCVDNAWTTPTLLTPAQSANMTSACISNNIQDYSSYEAANSLFALRGGASMNKVANHFDLQIGRTGVYVFNDYFSYVKPDGSKVSEKDLSWIYNPQEGFKSQTNAVYYNNIENDPSSVDHLDAAAREEARAQIARYNSLSSIMDESNAQEGLTTKSSPICPEIFPKEEPKEETASTDKADNK
jgi:hypothetical protein